MDLRIPVSRWFLHGTYCPLQIGCIGQQRYPPHYLRCRALSMSRISRLLLLLILLSGLVACGNKGDLVKPSAPADPAKASLGV